MGMLSYKWVLRQLDYWTLQLQRKESRLSHQEAEHEGQIDRSIWCAQQSNRYSQKAENLSWTLVTAWTPCTSSTEEDTPSAIHTAGWCNGVGLLRWCLGN